MSTVSDANVRARQLLYRHCQRSLDEAARLAELDLPPEPFFSQFLQRVQQATGAVAAAVWGSSPAGTIQAQHQINLAQIRLEDPATGGPSHEALLHHAFQTATPLTVAPRSACAAAGTDARAGNPTDFVILVTPILVDKQVAGLLEMWIGPPEHADTPAVLLQFLAGMAHHASSYTRNRQRQTLAGLHELWLRLEGFSQHIHDSLDLSEVANTVANEGRLLAGGDRLSVVGRRGSRTVVEAISGVDVINPRSRQVQLLSGLGEQVLNWGEPLVYRGEPDPSLPPGVVQALDDYLAECNSKLLVALPRRSEGATRKPRFVLLLECFEPNAPPEQALQRLEVIGRHAHRALDNAADYHRVPLRWLWQLLGRLQEGLGRATLVGAVLFLAVAGLVAVLITVPYPLKMEANGQLLPRERRCLYSPVEGQVVRFELGVEPGASVVEDQSLVLMYDMQLEFRLDQLANEVASAQEEIVALAAQQTTLPAEADRLAVIAEKKQKEFLRDRKLAELRALRQRTHADEGRPGYFWLRAPLGGTVLSWAFRERLTNRFVKPSDPLLRIGAKEHGWEVELRIPHTHIGPILEAFLSADAGAELDVDLLLLSAPTRTFRGKLSRDRIAAEASPDREASSPEPVVRASVRIDGPDLPAAERIPVELLVTGTEVHSKIRCGDRPLGYSLFHGVWEFVCEKVLFF